MERKRISYLRRVLPISLSIVLAAVLLAVTVLPGQAYSVPLISIVSVDKNVSVTISGAYFPTGRIYTVRMGAYGTLGIGGTVVGSYDSSAGSSFAATYAIPSSLVGADRIAIRLDSGDGYYSFNWFYNDTSATTTVVPAVPEGYSGYPTFDISTVSTDSSVTILTHNMPSGQAFTVRMGDYGTYGVGGIVVGTTADSGGSFSATYAIPAELAGQAMIAIRMDGPTGYYAYNWFYNNTAAVPPAPAAGYTGFPYIYIASVVRDSTVTVYAYNFPAGQTFHVKMGAYGTLGIGGIEVASFDSGSGISSFSATYNIPAALTGSDQIAIRIESDSGYYYAFNWFYNNTTN